MGAQAIYLMSEAGADPAIERGLVDAECEVRAVHSVAEA